MSSPESGNNFTVWVSLLNSCEDDAERTEAELMIGTINAYISDLHLTRSLLTEGAVDESKIRKFLERYKVPDELKARAAVLLRHFLQEKAKEVISFTNIPADKIELKNDGSIWSGLEVSLIGKLNLRSSEAGALGNEIKKLRQALKYQIGRMIVNGEINDEKIRKLINVYDFPGDTKEDVAIAVCMAIKESVKALMIDPR